MTNTVTCADGGWDVDKSSAPTTGTEVAPGDEITYRVVVRPENGVATDVVVTDELSATRPVRGSLRVSAGEVTPDGTRLIGRLSMLDRAERPECRRDTKPHEHGVSW